jgi:hypothetical protein
LSSTATQAHAPAHELSAGIVQEDDGRLLRIADERAVAGGIGRVRDDRRLILADDELAAGNARAMRKGRRR